MTLSKEVRERYEELREAEKTIAHWFNQWLDTNDARIKAERERDALRERYERLLFLALKLQPLRVPRSEREKALRDLYDAAVLHHQETK